MKSMMHTYRLNGYSMYIIVDNFQVLILPVATGGESLLSTIYKIGELACVLNFVFNTFPLGEYSH